MNNFSTKKRFIDLNEPSFYLRVDELHSLDILVGINDKNQKTIKFLGDFKPSKVKSSKIIDVIHSKTSDRLVLSFSLLDNHYSDMFYMFCDDLVNSSREVDPKDGYIFLTNRYEKWRVFGSSTRKYLSENEIKGLLGELLFIDSFLINKYGEQEAITGWTGMEPTKKDFYFHDYWYEIKSTTSNNVTISSFEQLDGKKNGFLMCYVFEKLSSNSLGLSIKSLVNSVLDKLIHEISRYEFLYKLAESGYYFEEYYDDFVFDAVARNSYKVDHTFPRITRSDVSLAIVGIKYDISINALEEYRKDIE